jgi:transcriptional regulator with XRE-family HTH domain
MTEFGPLLAEYRKAHGISQFKLAAWMDCHHTHISRIETGSRHPSRRLTERLVGVLSLNTREANIFRLAAGFAPVHTKGVRA